MFNPVSLFDQYGALFLFFLIAVTDAGMPIPIPYDLVIMWSGYRSLPLWQVILAVMSGAVVGNSILYFLAHTFGYQFLEKNEKFFFLTQRFHKKVEGWFSRFGFVFVAVARLLPGFRFAGSFVAGVLRLPYKKSFLPTMIFASSLWAIIYYYIGKAVGDGIVYFLTVGSQFKIFSLLPIAIILSVALTVILKSKKGSSAIKF